MHVVAGLSLLAGFGAALVAVMAGAIWVAAHPGEIRVLLGWLAARPLLAWLRSRHGRCWSSWSLASGHRAHMGCRSLPVWAGLGLAAIATARLCQRLPATRVLVLTTYADDTTILPALRADAAGYLTKDASAEEIEDAIRAVHAGRTHLDPAV